MKKIYFAFILLFLISFDGFSQLNKINNLFEKYEDVEGITSIKIGKPMFKMLNNLNIAEDEDFDKIKPLLKDINSIQILIFEAQKKDSTGQLVQKHYDNKKVKEEIYSSIKNLHFDELISVVTQGRKIKFLSDNKDEHILNKLILSITSDNQNILMLLDGKINMDNVSKLINEN